MTATFDFDGAVVLVTGAGGTLGSATVEAFHGAGATVHAADVIAPEHDGYRLEAGRDRLETHVVDFTDPAAVESTIEAVIDVAGRLDALASIAGTWRGGEPIEDTDPETFELLFDVNVRTTFLAAKYALPYLQESRGSLVTVASRSSLSGGEGDGLYRASKAAVRLLTESVAAENEGLVRANSILPGVIDTPANREAMPDADFERWTDPADIASVIAFLCSDAAGPISGASIPVAGES